MARNRTVWSEEKVREALRCFAICGNLSQASREIGVPKSTLRGWVLKNSGQVAQIKEEYFGACTDSFIKEAAQFKDEFGSGARKKLLACVGAVEKVLKRPRLTGHDVATLIRELTKALQLIEGEPTERHEVTFWDRIKDLMEEEEE